MNSVLLLTRITMVLLVLSGLLAAQTSEVTIGPTQFPKLSWGLQRMSFEVTNNTDWLKFLIVETEVIFESSYVNPRRVKQTNFVLEPYATRVVDPVMEIPGNYGDVTVWLRVHDVVDTLDDISAGVKVFEQPFSLKFPVPEKATAYLQEKIVLPPLVANAPEWDSEFARLLLVMLGKGMSFYEIAAIMEADTAYVRSVADRLTRANFLSKEQNVYTLLMPIISLAEAEEARELAVKTSDKLAELIAGNLKTLPNLTDSLVQAGAFSGDSTNFSEGSTLLYRPYPMIAVMLLWYDLGSRFIGDSQNIDVFQGSDVCRPSVGKYMYLTQAGDFFNGTHYYNPSARNRGLEIQFGDRIPSVVCQPGFEKKRRLIPGRDWTYEEDFQPESFVYDVDLVHAALRHLAAGAPNILDPAAKELEEIDQKHREGEFTPGILYWFWNLTATRTVKQLVDADVIKRPARGQYRLIMKQR